MQVQPHGVLRVVQQLEQKRSDATLLRVLPSGAWRVKVQHAAWHLGASGPHLGRSAPWHK